MLIGINGRNDFWQGQFTENDYRVIREAKIELVKLFEFTRLEVVRRLRAEQPAIRFIVRLYEETQPPGSPAAFVEKHAAAIESFRPYTDMFEILNEPNHPQEGWGGPDVAQAGRFNDWFLQTLALLHRRHPWARFGFPPLSPTMLNESPMYDLEWLEACRPAIEAADWLAVHCYWFDAGGVVHPAYGLRFTEYHERFPGKTLHITEFNGGPQLEAWQRAEQYVQYYKEAAQYDYIASASSFILSSPDSHFHPLQWWQPETGQPYPVAWAVGQIPRPLRPGPDDRPLYGVEYISHNTPDTMIAGRQTTVQFNLRNTGRKVWPEAGIHMVRLSYHWHQADGEPLPPDLWAQHRSRLPFDMRPDDRATVYIILEAPRLAGDFVVRWDMVEEFVTWFAWQDAPTLDAPVRVEAESPPPPGEMKATASHNNVEEGYDNLGQAFDGNRYTRWSSLHPQRPGMWFRLDLGQERTISQIKLDNDQSPMDYPRGYRLQLSTDGRNWTTVADRPENNGPVDEVFSARPVRFIRLEQTGQSDRWWWSIHEIYLSERARSTARASHNNVTTGADNLLQALDGNPESRWSSRALQRPGQWFEIDLNERRSIRRLVLDNARSPMDYPRGYIVRLSEDGQNWGEVARNPQNSGLLDISFSPRPARFIRIEQTGSADRWWWSIHRVGVE